MNLAHICIIGLSTLLIMGTNASAAVATITLVQTAKPIHRTYPGVDASILGIRTGMTVSEAEAIVKSIYPKAPINSHLSPVELYFLAGPRGSIKAKPFAGSSSIFKSNGVSADSLDLYFASPATGHVVDGISRKVTFVARKFPLIADIKASLIKKYGPPSYVGPQTDQQKKWDNDRFGGLTIAWIFNNNSREICKSYNCVGITHISPYSGYRNLSKRDRKTFDIDVRKDCGISAGSSAVFEVLAEIGFSTNGAEYDRTLAGDVTVIMWDAQACVNDSEQVRTQFEAAADKLFSKASAKVSKSPSSAVENVPPGTTISFYGDFGRGFGSQKPFLAPPSAFVIRPSTLYVTEDGSIALIDLRWSGWGTSVARATGMWSASNGIPSQAAGKRTTSPARLTLSSPGIVLGRWVYRCFRIDRPNSGRDQADRGCISQQGGIYSYN